MRRVAVAGATGYTGRRIMERLADHAGWRGRALVRPESAGRYAAPGGQEARPVDFALVPALIEALRGCDAVIQTIGTTRAQFRPGVSYATVDFGTTQTLLAAASRAGVGRFLLLSSAGAGTPVGAYLRWKDRTERLVRAGALDWTIVRPSAIVGPGRRAMQLVLAPLAPLGGLAPWLRAITADQLAGCFVNCLDDPTTINQTLEGPALWARV
ncbi:MAG TPA: NAD(P)H-binding protein [Herpetosiphonaceae bacterium]